MEELLYKLIYCEGLGIVGKWRLLHFAMKFDYTDFNIDEMIKITNTSGNKGVLKESWQTLTTEWLQEKRNTQKSISFFSERYPESLKNIAQPPLALFYEGNIDFLEYPSIAMVGARLATHYASQVLYQFIPKLVLENLVIVSGLAKGVDRLSHELAILAGGKTIGVIGCGRDRCYPKEVSTLFQEMKQKQLV